MAPKADVEGAKRAFPLIDASADELEERMRRDPTIAYNILYDMAAKMRAAEERRLGVKRTGRRVRGKMSRDQMHREALGPTPSMEPFVPALKLLMDGRSQDTFAKLMGISQGHLSKLLTGVKQPDRDMMELAAAAANVPPWYFLEWRSLYMADWVQMILDRHPNISLTLIKNVAPNPEIRWI